MPKSKQKIDEITIVLIVALGILVISLSSTDNKPDGIEAEKITAMILDDHAISFASGGIVDESKLQSVQNMPYADFKDTLNAKKDFCIYIEDGDGNVILVKGSSKLTRDGLHCKG